MALYKDSADKIDTARKILKVNHAGEFGAINIYRAQIMVSRLLGRDYVSMLEGFLQDECKHLEIFWVEIQRRKGIKCKSYWLCGLGGWGLGFVSALLGKRGIMACTWAVESVVIHHLEQQLVYLKKINDPEAVVAVSSILDDEQHHRNMGLEQGGKRNIFYSPFRWSVMLFTMLVIRFGMR